MDTFSKTKRSEIMRRVKSKDTSPEMRVRKLTHYLGYRYRLHGRKLPGKPDLVFSSRKKVIFVNGCFWHGHSCRAGQNRPASNKDYWITKLEKNKKRDKENQRKLVELGWDYLIIWECQTKDTEKLKKKINDFLA